MTDSASPLFDLKSELEALDTLEGELIELQQRTPRSHLTLKLCSLLDSLNAFCGAAIRRNDYDSAFESANKVYAYTDQSSSFFGPDQDALRLQYRCTALNNLSCIEQKRDDLNAAYGYLCTAIALGCHTPHTLLNAVSVLEKMNKHPEVAVGYARAAVRTLSERLDVLNTELQQLSQEQHSEERNQTVHLLVLAHFYLARALERSSTHDVRAHTLSNQQNAVAHYCQALALSRAELGPSHSTTQKIEFFFLGPNATAAKGLLNPETLACSSNFSPPFIEQAVRCASQTSSTTATQRFLQLHEKASPFHKSRSAGPAPRKVASSPPKSSPKRAASPQQRTDTKSPSPRRCVACSPPPDQRVVEPEPEPEASIHELPPSDNSAKTPSPRSFEPSPAVFEGAAYVAPLSDRKVDLHIEPSAVVSSTFPSTAPGGPGGRRSVSCTHFTPTPPPILAPHVTIKRGSPNTSFKMLTQSDIFTPASLRNQVSPILQRSRREMSPSQLSMEPLPQSRPQRSRSPKTVQCETTPEKVPEHTVTATTSPELQGHKPSPPLARLPGPAHPLKVSEPPPTLVMTSPENQNRIQPFSERRKLEEHVRLCSNEVQICDVLASNHHRHSPIRFGTLPLELQVSAFSPIMMMEAEHEPPRFPSPPTTFNPPPSEARSGRSRWEIPTTTPDRPFHPSHPSSASRPLITLMTPGETKMPAPILEIRSSQRCGKATTEGSFQPPGPMPSAKKERAAQLERSLAALTLENKDLRHQLELLQQHTTKLFCESPLAWQSPAIATAISTSARSTPPGTLSRNSQPVERGSSPIHFEGSIRTSFQPSANSVSLNPRLRTATLPNGPDEDDGEVYILRPKATSPRNHTTPHYALPTRASRDRGSLNPPRHIQPPEKRHVRPQSSPPHHRPNAGEPPNPRRSVSGGRSVNRAGRVDNRDTAVDLWVHAPSISRRPQEPNAAQVPPAKPLAGSIYQHCVRSAPTASSSTFNTLRSHSQTSRQKQ